MEEPVGEGWASKVDEFAKLVPWWVMLLAAAGGLFLVDGFLVFCWDVFLTPEFDLKPLTFVSGLGLLGIIIIVVGVLVGLKSGE